MRKFIHNNNLAIIDVGSGSVRLFLRGKKTVIMTKLSEGLDRTCLLQPEPMRRTAEVIREFARTAAREKCSVSAFATEAVRAAANKDEFLQLIKQTSGVTLNVIDGQTEARIALLGVCPSGSASVIDIGGASVEIITGENGNIRYSKSLPVGMVRLTEQAGGKQSSLSELARRAAAGFKDAPLIGDIRGVGGTFTSIAAMLLGLTVYDSDRVHCFRIELSALADLKERVLSTTGVDELISLFPSLHPMRASLIPAGVVFVEELLNSLKKEAVTVSECDNLEGWFELLSRGEVPLSG